VAPKGYFSLRRKGLSLSLLVVYLRPVQRLFSSFPSGLAGGALVLLRLSLAASLIGAAFLRSGAHVPFPVLALVGVIALAVLLGVMLPLCCAVAVGSQLILAQLSGWPSPMAVVIETAQTAALGCLGAGAYSVDAILYGRRVVVLPKDR
jgi:hypothetical protein